MSASTSTGIGVESSSFLIEPNPVATGIMVPWFVRSMILCYDMVTVSNGLLIGIAMAVPALAALIGAVVLAIIVIKR